MNMTDEHELWPGKEFSLFAIKLHRSRYGWVAATAAKLGVSKEILMHWAAKGAPLSVRDELQRMSGIDDENAIAFPRDEWIVSTMQSGPAGRIKTGREYIIHTRAPRFIARIVGMDDEGYPIPSEDPTDIVSGVTYVRYDGDIFCEIQWIDARPQGEERADLLLEACNALDWWSKSDPRNTGMLVH